MSSARVRRALVLGASVAVALVMCLLGLWQMASYEASTRDVSAERASETAVALADQVATNGQITDIYGKRVTLSGTFDTAHEVLVGTQPPYRVVTALKLTDGRYVAIVRGATDSRSDVPPAPQGSQDFEGIFLASDKPDAEANGTRGELATVRIQSLAQEWPTPLIAGYVTLSAADSAAQGLAEAALTLPEAEGSPTHRGYALQWWVFAAGAIAFGVYTARGIKDVDEELPQSADNPVLPTP